MSKISIERLEARCLLSAAHGLGAGAWGVPATFTSPAAAAKPAAKAAPKAAGSTKQVAGPSDVTQIATTALTPSQVSQILAQAASQAAPGQVITVTDREGTILGMYAGSGVNPAELLGVEFLSAARARTASAFESTQTAFSTRTARFIIQNHFPQPVNNTPGGPLYGVEFSSFPGSDVLPSVGIMPGSGLIGLNTGISGDPGGLPLFLNGIPVGGIGVAGDLHDQAPNTDLKAVLENELPRNIISDGNALVAKGDAADVTAGNAFIALGNSLGMYEKQAIGNRVFNGTESADFDESVALAGSVGYEAPALDRANQIVIAGLTFPYTASPHAHGKPALSLDQLVANGSGTLVDAPFLGYGTPTSTPTLLPGEPELNNAALPVQPTPGNNEVTSVPGQFRIRDAAAAEAAGVDVQGVPYADTPTMTGSTTIPQSDYQAPADGSTNGADPSNLLQLNSSNEIIPAVASGTLGNALTTADVQQVITQTVEQALIERGGIRKPNGAKARIHVVVTDLDGNVLGTFRMGDATNFSFDVAVQKARTAAYFSSNNFAFTCTALGFMSQGFFPPGINGGGPGPLYRLQDELMDDPANLLKQAAPVNASGTPDAGPLPDGITIFPGGDPLYINGVLVGAVGVSGDGVVQDDQMAYAGTAGFHPPDNIRDDVIGTSDASAAASFLVGKINNLATTYGVNLGNFNTTKAEQRLVNGLSKVHLPYVKFPRNPTDL